jgi:hypothetical protein
VGSALGPTESYAKAKNLDAESAGTGCWFCRFYVETHAIEIGSDGKRSVSSAEVPRIFAEHIVPSVAKRIVG